jgi:ribosomal protein S27AE
VSDEPKWLEIPVPLNVGVKPEDGEISSISYCNYCGSGFFLDNGKFEYCGKCNAVSAISDKTVLILKPDGVVALRAK